MNLKILCDGKKGIKFRDTPEGKTTLTPDDDKYLKANYLIIPIKRIASNLCKTSDLSVRTRMKQLGLVVPPELIEQRKKESCFSPGHVPKNKEKKWHEYLSPEIQARCLAGGYKKGQIPPNKKNIGDVAVRTYGVHKGRKEYKIQWIKVGNGNLDWIPLHIYNWTTAGNVIPEGFVLAFKNGNQMNPELDNLELISMKENMLRNSIQNYPEDLKEIMMIKGRITRQINKISKQKP